MSLIDSIGLLCLAIEHGANNEVGRTKLQKMIYFASRHLGWQIGNFKLHYYGPYSRSLANTLQNTKGILVDETGSDGGPYKYALTDSGKTLLQEFPDYVHNEALLCNTRQMFLALSSWTKDELELSATLDFVQRNTPKIERSDLIKKVSNIKENFPQEKIEQAYNKLSEWKKENNFQ